MTKKPAALVARKGNQGKTKTASFRRDIKIAGKSVTVRVSPQVWERFEQLAKELDMPIAEAARQAKAAAGGDYSQAIEAFVKASLGNQPLYAHKTREAWLGALTDALRPVFKARGYNLPAKIVCTMGFPSTGWRGKRRGECWSTGMSAGGNVEIFIHPCETNVLRIANILTHELCHAADEQYYYDNPKMDKHGNPRPFKGGHGKRWTMIAHALDITEGKGTHALGGAEWAKWATPIVDSIGPMPFDPLSEFVKKPKVQTTRMLKFTHVDCKGLDEGGDFIWRSSAKGMIDKPRVSCPCCGTKIANEHYGDADDSEEGEE